MSRSCLAWISSSLQTLPEFFVSAFATHALGAAGTGVSVATGVGAALFLDLFTQPEATHKAAGIDKSPSSWGLSFFSKRGSFLSSKIATNQSSSRIF